MTNRRKPEQRSTSTEWKPTTPRTELIKAIGGASAVVLLTVLVIFLIKPADSATTDPGPVPVTTPSTIPESVTGSTAPTGATGSLPTDSTTIPTQPADSTTTTPTQP